MTDTFRSYYPAELLAAKATADAVDRVVGAMSVPVKPRKLQLDDALHILDNAIANFGEFEDERIKDAMADLGRAYQVMEVAVAAVESEYPSEPEPYEAE